MAATMVEAACLEAFGVPSSKLESSPYDQLHTRVAQMRIASDSGLTLKDSVDKVAVQKAREQARLRAILQMNMGSAMGMANAGELLFQEVLPSCGHWGDRVMQQFAARGFDQVPMARLGGIGSETRPAIPSPLQVGPLQRVGPHGSPEALRTQELPICSYSQIIEEARAEACNAAAPTFETGVTMGNRLSGEDESDRISDAEHGRRVWPPAAFQSTAAAKEAADITTSINAVVDQLNVEDKLLACVPGVYSSTVEFVLANQTLSPVHRDAYAALGVGASEGRRKDVELARSRTHLMAALAHATGHGDLGKAFTQLAYGPITKCARKPWV